MKVTERTPVGDIVAKYPRAARIFETHRIDYCCGGDHPLHEACDAAGAPPQLVLAEVMAAVVEPAADRDWTTNTLTDLVSHIVGVHHAYLRTELPVLGKRLDTVTAAHGVRHGASLSALSAAFADLHRELDPHLDKEEQVLFPAILRCAQAGGECDAAGLRAPIAVMQQEHESAGRTLKQMRRVASDYVVPPDGCATYRALFDGLILLEADLHRHIHLENNILFPRVIALGAALG